MPKVSPKKTSKNPEEKGSNCYNFDNIEKIIINTSIEECPEGLTPEDKVDIGKRLNNKACFKDDELSKVIKSLDKAKEKKVFHDTVNIDNLKQKLLHK